MTSEFMIALYGSFAQAESESISKNVSWGKEKAYREGKVQFQYKYLLGYKKGEDGNSTRRSGNSKADIYAVSRRIQHEQDKKAPREQRHFDFTGK